MEFIVVSLALLVSAFIYKEQKRASGEEMAALEFYGLILIALFLFFIGLVTLLAGFSSDTSIKVKTLAGLFFLEIQARLLMKSKQAKSKEDIELVNKGNMFKTAYSIGVIPETRSILGYLVLFLMGIQALIIVTVILM